MKLQVILIQKGTLEKIEGTKLWKVDQPYIWELRNGSSQVIVVKKGFITDFGSIPRLLWFIFNPTEFNAYILHDYLYQFHTLSRNKADIALDIALTSEGCHPLAAYFIWLGVRVGGWYYFYKNKYKGLI